jgi:hypothetical protein
VNYSTSAGTAVSPADFTATSGTVTFAPDVISAQVTVAIAGDVLDEANETFNLNLSGATNATIGDPLGVATITDDDASPSVVISNVSVNEPLSGTANAVFTVTMSAVSGRAVSVNYASQNASAVSGADYTATAGTLTIPAGVTSGQVTVPVLPDALNEASETFNVNLSAAVGVTIADTQGVATIVDNDPLPSIRINDITVTEGAAGVGSVATFTVTLSAVSGRTVTVNYATVNGNATAPSDYTAKSGTVTLAAGVLTQTFSIAVIGDAVREATEVFGVSLSAGVNATIADNLGVCTILNDD